ncbi:LacI family DNA-binding transcriptional regulator [Parvularcula sp. LCG005]|uniref:LacI family DNA-binding transcriptional regulator n=1 Tax=Parvularcula sp. LCG005 TaxID=3078805 RepID=UPI002942BF6F|nr:LacI family DNA-binding transcriptional regulator [Parvularcula sp. LCG005]WOI53478.1 LacI family DNA-binding transcriptional regulator [Parvularcula sp. LCG005]
MNEIQACSMSRRQQITIKEVAAHAGVSQMTVSRVLNRASMVREETREKVEAAIKALNYRPNLMARGLAAGKALSIGLIYNNPSHGYLGELLIGAMKSCREAGHHLMVEDLYSEHEALEPTELAERLFDMGLDGVIIAPPLSHNHDVIKALRDWDVSFVLIAPGDIAGNDPTVTIDDAAAAQSMTQYLIDRGYRDIGFIIGPTNQTASGDRYDGFRKAMLENDIAIDDNLIAKGAFTYRSGMVAAQRLLSLPKRPAAIFASNDDMAAGAIAAAHSMGLKVPGDLAIVGFDDTPIANAIWPQLTTVRQPIADMAHRAVSMLSERILGEQSSMPDEMVLPVSIVERESVS